MENVASKEEVTLGENEALSVHGAESSLDDSTPLSDQLNLVYSTNPTNLERKETPLTLPGFTFSSAAPPDWGNVVPPSFSVNMDTESSTKFKRKTEISPKSTRTKDNHHNLHFERAIFSPSEQILPRSIAQDQYPEYKKLKGHFKHFFSNMYHAKEFLRRESSGIPTLQLRSPPLAFPGAPFMTDKDIDKIQTELHAHSLNYSSFIRTHIEENAAREKVQIMKLARDLKATLSTSDFQILRAKAYQDANYEFGKNHHSKPLRSATSRPFLTTILNGRVSPVTPTRISEEEVDQIESQESQNSLPQLSPPKRNTKRMKSTVGVNSTICVNSTKSRENAIFSSPTSPPMIFPNSPSPLIQCNPAETHDNELTEKINQLVTITSSLTKTISDLSKDVAVLKEGKPYNKIRSTPSLSNNALQNYQPRYHQTTTPQPTLQQHQHSTPNQTFQNYPPRYTYHQTTTPPPLLQQQPSTSHYNQQQQQPSTSHYNKQQHSRPTPQHPTHTQTHTYYNSHSPLWNCSEEEQPQNHSVYEHEQQPTINHHPTYHNQQPHYQHKPVHRKPNYYNPSEKSYAQAAQGKRNFH